MTPFESCVLAGWVGLSIAVLILDYKTRRHYRMLHQVRDALLQLQDNDQQIANKITEMLNAEKVNA